MINRLSTVIIFDQALEFMNTPDYKQLLNNFLKNGNSKLNKL
jgi:hypothetical protein